MESYIGMTSTDPYIIKRKLESNGWNVQNFMVVKSGLYYDDAQALEEKHKQTKGLFRCCGLVSGSMIFQGYIEPAGQRKPGSVYSVYTYENENKNQSWSA